MDFRRGETATDRLAIDWLHPVPPRRQRAHTQSSAPLSFIAAMALFWEPGDDRPLLVLRECDCCGGADNEVLGGAFDGERARLSTAWCRTLKLPAHVLMPTHPFHQVFASLATDRGTPHCFLLASPQARPIAFDGKPSPADLQKSMLEVLGQRYAKNPQQAVKKWLQLLSTFDELDARERQLQEQLDEARAASGPDSDSAQKLTAALARIRADRRAALQQEAELKDLGLFRLQRDSLVAVK